MAISLRFIATSELGSLGTSNSDTNNKEYERKKCVKINIVYKREKEWFVGHIQEYPDYESQGKTLEELKDNLIEIYDDIRKGLVPDAKPFQILEVAI